MLLFFNQFRSNSNISSDSSCVQISILPASHLLISLSPLGTFLLICRGVRDSFNSDRPSSKSCLTHNGQNHGSTKSFYDSDKKRRRLWSWISEGDGETYDIKKGWSGLLSIPKSIWLSENGDQLVQWHVKELEKLRTQKEHYENIELKGGSMFEISGITALQLKS
ncbi:hypothetical protein L2E82_39844 [Cichorium intybus]|uniref:Uncharacterized protein n=1 Tax=Cichorium intybus TaxID=13427 RepID=A0ACB9AJZ0_CICIN|nr:hypothetical protein L2E82_39844 [Cichorium intybus]